ncbi:MAG TPA: ribokinase [Terriglobales bacterium]|nr:ribokinase [Terriglobales bacterium]
MNAPRITVVGSYATGLTMKAERLPGRGETLLGSGYRVDFGGKGSNQAIGCARLGAKVSFVAKVGEDSFGEGALGLYRDEGIDTSHVQRTADAPTGVGFITVEASTGHNCIVLDPGANELLSSEDVSASSPVFDSVAVVLTQLEIPVETAEAAMRLGRAQGAITILNPAPARPVPASLLQSVDILTPNETEAAVLAGHKGQSARDPQQVARELIRLGVKTVIVTLGEKGALVVNASSSVHVPAIEVSAVDTTGAGDAFNAGLAAALAFGAPLEEAVRFAAVTGGLAVTREGVVPALPDRGEVAAYYRSQRLTAPQWLGLQSRADGAS